MENEEAIAAEQSPAAKTNEEAEQDARVRGLEAEVLTAREEASGLRAHVAELEDRLQSAIAEGRVAAQACADNRQALRNMIAALVDVAAQAQRAIR